MSDRPTSDSPLIFDRVFDPRHGERVAVSPLVARVTANNPGPFTFHGTNTWLVGTSELAVIDPGPDDPAHVAAILAAVGSARVTAILVTHTHRDHSPAAAALQVATGAPIWGEGPHRPARPLDLGEINPMDASSQGAFRHDRVLGDGDVVSGPDWTLEAIATPGHTANHLCFALAEEKTLFTGDHVMAWSTSIVAPPDGAMVDYMASLRRLMARDDRLLLPAHGAGIGEPLAFLRGLEAHRLGREAAVFAAFRRAAERPEYRIEKRPALRGRQGMWALVNEAGAVLKRGHELGPVLAPVERRLMKLVEG